MGNGAKARPARRRRPMAQSQGDHEEGQGRNAREPNRCDEFRSVEVMRHDPPRI
jgi:hypothetical protein